MLHIIFNTDAQRMNIFIPDGVKRQGANACLSLNITFQSNRVNSRVSLIQTESGKRVV